jgi:phage major head subunit gpT-like protein
MSGRTINDEKADLLKYDLQSSFDPAYESAKAKSHYEILTMVDESEKPIVQHDWMLGAPALKKVLDEREIVKLSREKFLVSVDQYAIGIEALQSDIEDDNTGKYMRQVAAMGDRAGLAYDSLAFQYLAAGFGTTLGTCFDGKALFSTTHALGGQTISNKGTKTLDDSGALDEGIQAFNEMVDVHGDPMEEAFPTHLIVGPKRWKQAKILVEQLFGASGESNVNAGLLKVVLNKRFVGAAAEYWCIADLSHPTKPLGMQIRKRPVFDSVLSGKDRFERFVYYYGTEARHAAFYGYYPYIWGSDGTA